MNYQQNQDFDQDLQNPTLVFSEGNGLSETGKRTTKVVLIRSLFPLRMHSKQSAQNTAESMTLKETWPDCLINQVGT